MSVDGWTYKTGGRKLTHRSAPTRSLEFLTAIALLAYASTVLANATVFEDDYGQDWTKGTWDVYVDTEQTRNDSTASLRRTGGVILEVANPDGLDIRATPILQAYVNFLVTDATPGHSLTNIKVGTTDGTLFEFDDRSEGWVCYLDETEYTDASEIMFDVDPDTWQLFEIDLSQADYFGWPYQSRQIGDATITSLSFSPYGNTTGKIAMYVDDISLVPEPTTISLLGLGVIALFPKRKKRAAI